MIGEATIQEFLLILQLTYTILDGLSHTIWNLPPLWSLPQSQSTGYCKHCFGCQSWRSKKFCWSASPWPGSNLLCPQWADRQNFFFDLQLWQPVNLLPFDLQRPTVLTYLERSKPPWLTQFLFKALAALFMHFISVQSDLHF